MKSVMISNALEKELDAKELQGLIDESIATLPEKCREVFYLTGLSLFLRRKLRNDLRFLIKPYQVTKALKILNTSLNKLAVFVLFIVL